MLDDSIRRARIVVMHKEYGYTVFDKKTTEQVVDVLEVEPIENNGDITG